MLDAAGRRQRRPGADASSTAPASPLLWLVVAGVLALLGARAGAGLAGPAHPPLRQPAAGRRGRARRAGRRWSSAASRWPVRRQQRRARARRLVRRSRWPRRTARIAAFDAKANESLTLIARGSGAAFEEAWQASSPTRRRADGASASDRARTLEALPWTAYTTRAPGRSATLDDGGNWDEAVALATGTGRRRRQRARSTPSTRASGDALDGAARRPPRRSTRTGGGSAARRRRCSACSLGLVAAALAWWGVAQRLEEYR